jgi:hypothetical protein
MFSLTADQTTFDGAPTRVRSQCSARAGRTWAVDRRVHGTSHEREVSDNEKCRIIWHECRWNGGPASRQS